MSICCIFIYNRTYHEHISALELLMCTFDNLRNMDTDNTPKKINPFNLQGGATVKQGVSEEEPGVTTYVFCQISFIIFKTMAEVCSVLGCQVAKRRNSDPTCITKGSENPRPKLSEKNRPLVAIFQNPVLKILNKTGLKNVGFATKPMLFHVFILGTQRVQSNMLVD